MWPRCIREYARPQARLPTINRGIGIYQGCATRAKRLDFRAAEDNPRFYGVFNVVVVARFTVSGHHFFRRTLSAWFHHLFFNAICAGGYFSRQPHSPSRQGFCAHQALGPEITGDGDVGGNHSQADTRGKSKGMVAIASEV